MGRDRRLPFGPVFSCPLDALRHPAYQFHTEYISTNRMDPMRAVLIVVVMGRVGVTG